MHQAEAANRSYDEYLRFEHARFMASGWKRRAVHLDRHFEVEAEGYYAFTGDDVDQLATPYEKTSCLFKAWDKGWRHADLRARYDASLAAAAEIRGDLRTCPTCEGQWILTTDAGIRGESCPYCALLASRAPTTPQTAPVYVIRNGYLHYRRGEPPVSIDADATPFPSHDEAARVLRTLNDQWQRHAVTDCLTASAKEEGGGA